jgi:hypothetical protein
LQDVRYGVRLTPLKARIFDLIESRPGITRREICDIVYDSVTEAAVYTVGSHVKQIRDKFLATDIVVRGVPNSGGYWVKKNG